MCKCYVIVCDIKHRTEAKKKMEEERTLVGEKTGQQRGEGQWGEKREQVSEGWEAEDHLEQSLRILFFKFFWLHLVACRMLVLNQGSNRCPVPWRCRVLTTGPSRKSLLEF